MSMVAKRVLFHKRVVRGGVSSDKMTLCKRMEIGFYISKPQ